LLFKVVSASELGAGDMRMPWIAALTGAPLFTDGQQMDNGAKLA
jgi:hypothetical protein